MIINLNLNSKGPKLMKYVIKGASGLIFNSVIPHRHDHQHLDRQYQSKHQRTEMDGICHKRGLSFSTALSSIIGIININLNIGGWNMSYKGPDMRFVKTFTPPDFQAKKITPLISRNSNSFGDNNTKKWVKFTAPTKILHCRRQNEICHKRDICFSTPSLWSRS